MRQRYGIEGSNVPIWSRDFNEHDNSALIGALRKGRNTTQEELDRTGYVVGHHKQTKRSVSKTHEPSSFRHLLSPETRMRLEEWEARQRLSESKTNTTTKDKNL